MFNSALMPKEDTLKKNSNYKLQLKIFYYKNAINGNYFMGAYTMSNLLSLVCHVTKWLFREGQPQSCAT